MAGVQGSTHGCLGGLEGDAVRGQEPGGRKFGMGEQAQEQVMRADHFVA